MRNTLLQCFTLLWCCSLAAGTINFDSDTAGSAPRGFTAGLTGQGSAGRWLVQADATAPSQPNILVQAEADATSYRFPLCVYDGFQAADVDLAVKFKAISGKKDQAAGLVWRFQDTNNYYVVRANALENNVVLYKMENGKRTDLKPAGADTKAAYGKAVPVAPGQWHTLRLVARGNLFEVFLNGQKLFDVIDTTFTQAGKVGLWTKADSVTAFDDFVFEPIK